MLKITSFSALIAGLLLATPLVFSDAEAGRTDANVVASKSDRQSVDRLQAAFNLVDICTGAVSGDANSWCVARHAELADAANGKMALNIVTLQNRDEAAQTSTVAADPVR